MGEALQIKLPADIDWRFWIERWDKMQDSYLPLEWHFRKLRDSDFVAVDCFWRCDCDAIYGGIRQPT